MKKFFVKTFGCQYNEWDATRLVFALNKLGLVEADIKKAEIIFILNCSIRKSGVDRAMGLSKNLILNGKKVILAGCVLAADRPRFEKKGVVLWDGEDFDALAKILKLKSLNPLKTYEVVPSLPRDLNYQLKTSFVPIMKGCDNFCSYCAVPYVRGREVSRPFADIISDVKKLVAAGHREITLLGQNVNSYHAPAVILSVSEESRDPSALPRDNKSNNFASLLKTINDLEGNFIIKFTSNHPKDMSDEIIEAIATLPKIAKEIHLPLQSGSNKVLRSMNRPYTKGQYLELVDKIKKRIPDVKITTDVIVGYPNETEDDFKQTVKIFKKLTVWF